MRRLGAALFGTVSLVAFACDPIVGSPPAAVPRNECPAHFCEGYTQEGTKPQCSAGRCEAGKPTYPYLLVVDVPTTSFFGAGRSFVLDSRAFVGAKGTPRCPSISCIQLPALATVQTSLAVGKASAGLLGLPIPDAAQAPAAARATFVLLPPGADAAEKRTAADIGIPAVDFVSDLASVPSGVPASFAEMAPGRYERIVMPDDGLVPPVVSTLERLASEEIVIGSAGYTLDEPPVGKTRRKAHVSRMGGRDGFRVWLEDALTETRISTVHTLTSDPITSDPIDPPLDTVNQNDQNVLRANVNIVVGPPLGSVGIPTLKNGILQDFGFDITFPALPPPASVRGTVVSASGAPVAGNVVLDSQEIALVAPDKPVSFLRYRTTLQTDPRGAFATVLPPGSYAVTVLPSAARSLSRLRASITIAGDVTLAPLVVNELSQVSGRAVLTDGRPLSGAEVLALPSVVQPDLPDALKRQLPWLFPREARTVTATDGTFTIRAEEGTFDFVVIPQPGTGFGRTISPSRKVSPSSISTSQDAGIGDAGVGGNDLGTLLVPAPLKLSFTVLDPSFNPVPQAVVRALTLPTGHKEYVEIGSAMTSSQGQFEMLLAPVPR
jgi:hypothetical protein